MKRTLNLVATAILVLVIAPLATAQDPFARPKPPARDNPFAAKKPVPSAKGKEPPLEHRSDVSMRYETFSLDLTTAAALLRADQPDAKLYKTLLRMVDQETAVQEGLTIIRSKFGTRSSAQSNLEYIYPTEWDPAELPQSIGIKIDPPATPDPKPDPKPETDTGTPSPEGKKPAGRPAPEELPAFVTPATPTAFDVRNLGVAFEIEAFRGEDPGIIDAVVAPEHVTLSGLSSWGKGVSELLMPEIEAQKLQTQVSLAPGLPRLLGTINRSHASKIDPNASERIWFAFLTASYVK